MLMDGKCEPNIVPTCQLNIKIYENIRIHVCLSSEKYKKE